MIASPASSMEQKSTARRDAPLTNLVDRWIDHRRHCDELVRRWQSAESGLSGRAKAEGIPFEEAFRRAWPEVEEMSALMARIELFDRELPNTAETIMSVAATSADDAMAKIRLGLCMREPSPDDVVAWALVETGYKELCEFSAKSDD